MKKLINEPRRLVRELLEGTVDLSPGLALLESEDVVLRADLPPAAERKVSVISGGGSGHEPAHAGYVGKGMLTAAVAGDVFTSPSTDAVLAAILAASGPAGCVLVVKNYTGDRLNFGLAAELARQQGIPVEVVIVADDVALRDIVAKDRRRGIAGTVLVHKLAGAAAERGLTVAEVASIARSAAASLGSMGVALGACTVPSVGKPGFEIGGDEIEFGLGIHGEKGVDRTAIQSAARIVTSLLDTIVSDLELKSGSKVALLVNGLGGTPPMELAIISREALADLRGRGIAVERAWCGNFMTAIEMPGCSLSVLPLDEQRNSLLDDPTYAPAWLGDGRLAARKLIKAPAQPQPSKSDPGPLSANLKCVTLAVAVALSAAEDELGDLDAKSGDGDLGASMARAADALRALGDDSYSTPSRLLFDAGNSLRRAIGGSSGPFYATALLRASASLSGKPVPSGQDWLTAFEAATSSIMELGGAKPGDRTMVDALSPAIEAWRRSGNFSDAATAAKEGAKATSDMYPALGRASYLGKRAIGHPDAGACAVVIWLTAISKAL
ncbi:MAG: dihydroxyacetone kinase subunit DhaK [Rhizobiaceae bacterium]|nr:dihydroxyacetone kinase subunit DhaK [Rhizobiaceae bacterium]